ncbi:hypothetical protein [Halomonas halmophila]|nr:hypothetical protein [Halomonas halmophila]
MGPFVEREIGLLRMSQRSLSPAAKAMESFIIEELASTGEA